MRVSTLLVLAALIGCEGPAGPEGPPGPPTASIVTQTSCAGRVQVEGATGLATAHYDITRYGSGDVFVSCAITDASRTYSTVGLYRAGSANAREEVCELVMDAYGGPTYGAFRFFHDPEPAPEGVWKYSYVDPGDVANNTHLMECVTDG